MNSARISPRPASRRRTQSEALLRQVVSILAMAMLLAGCQSAAGPAKGASSVSTHGGSGAPASSGPDPAWHVVALGDSVTSGTGCGCIPFPQMYGKDIADVRGRPTTVINLGKDGLNSAELLGQLDERGSSTATAVAAADIDLVTIGANDFTPSHHAVSQGQCLGDGNADCVQDELDQMRHNVSAILVRIRTLRAHRPTAVLITGYWNVFEDGDVARSRYPEVGVKAAQALTRYVNAALQQAARHSDATYVDLYKPFNGPEARGNTTNLLAADGDHPNEAGHALIARRLVAAGLPGLVDG
jgi:lysophospholipase L1-like esterase